MLCNAKQMQPHVKSDQGGYPLHAGSALHAAATVLMLPGTWHLPAGVAVVTEKKELGHELFPRSQEELKLVRKSLPGVNL